MKRRCFFEVFCLSILGFLACTKDTIITGADAIVFTSADTLHFGTLFNGTGSATQSFKIYNPNNQKLVIASINLGGGATSGFSINVNGMAATSFTNIEIAAKDSIYVFAKANITTGNTAEPRLVRDSIIVNYNTNKALIQLDAVGLNARFLNNAHITQDSSFTNDLPIVINGTLTINKNSLLTIERGTKIYCHSDARITVEGSLQALGEAEEINRIVFTGDRLDDYYKDLPGSWPGIYFAESSTNNQLNYTTVTNATTAIDINLPAENAQTKLDMLGCVISNAAEAGIRAVNTSINATNCLINNCGSVVQIHAGGNYHFIHCTLAAYNTPYLAHENPALVMDNIDGNTQAFALDARFINCIVYGDDGFVNDEISITQNGNLPFSVSVENGLCKTIQPAQGSFTNCIFNTDPQFMAIDYANNIYSFRLQPTSPAVNAGLTATVLTDITGKARDANPDIGCYELE